MHTKVAEQHWEEYESMSHPQKCNNQVQAEEEDLDELCFGKRQHKDAWQVGHCNTGEHLQDSKQTFRQLLLRPVK